MKSIFKKYPLFNIIILIMIVISCLTTCYSSYVLSLSIKKIEVNDMTNAIVHILAYFLLQLLASMTLALECYLEEVLKNKYKIYLRNEYSKYHSNCSVRKYFMEKEELLNLQLNNIDLFFSDYIDNIYNIAYNTVITFGGLIVMFYVFPLMAIIVIIGIIVSLIMSKINDKVSEKRVNSLMKENGIYNSSVAEILSGVTSIKINRLGSFFIKKSAIKSEKFETARQKYKNTITIISNLMYLPTFLIDIIILFLIVYFIYIGYIGFDVLAIYILIQGLVINNAESLFYNFTTAASGKKSLELDVSAESIKTKDVEKVDIKEIIFNDVELSYDDNVIFNNLNLTFCANKKYLLIGENGTGKSSIIKLLLKQIYNYNYSNIKYNNVSLNDIDDDLIYKDISYVQQQPYIFSNSIYYNIFYNERFSEDFINHILDTCCLNQLVNQNKEGLNYFIKNNGENISGGEKQKIAIARALASKPKILIMDEPLKNIDYKSAKKIINEILSIKDMTIIVISHDINDDIKNLCDEVIIINRKDY